jgi:hypothetical protein
VPALLVHPFQWLLGDGIFDAAACARGVFLFGVAVGVDTSRWLVSCLRGALEVRRHCALLENGAAALGSAHPVHRPGLASGIAMPVRRWWDCSFNGPRFAAERRSVRENSPRAQGFMRSPGVAANARSVGRQDSERCGVGVAVALQTSWAGLRSFGILSTLVSCAVVRATSQMLHGQVERSLVAVLSLCCLLGCGSLRRN